MKHALSTDETTGSTRFQPYEVMPTFTELLVPEGFVTAAEDDSEREKCECEAFLKTMQRASVKRIRSNT
jgi:hypothetical protein